jgi:hypothetical protein
MFDSSEDALECHETITLDRARAELARHGCRIIDTDCFTNGMPQLRVTNDCDAPEWIDCTPAAILAWLGY